MTYEFLCNSCGRTTEVNCPASKKPKYIICTNCGSDMKQKMCVPGIIVRGGASPPKPPGRPKDAIRMGKNMYAVPRRDKRGNLVRVADIGGRSDLPEDMQKQFDKKTEKDQRAHEQGKKTFGSKFKGTKHWETKR